VEVLSVNVLAGILVGFVAAVPVALATLNPAWAHASLVKSSPANGAVVTQAPSVIQATFSEELDKTSVMRLYDAHQTLIAKGGLDAKVANHRVLTITPPHLAAGKYSVQWVAISSDDGDVKKGAFTFSVAPMATVPPLHLIAPAAHTQLKNPVAVVIETSGDISQLTMGSTMAPMSGMSSMSTSAGMGPHVHLHILVDGTAYMPAASQLTKVGPDRYQYVLPKLATGPHTVKVFWADNSTHAPIGDVESATCTVSG
jgi:methionine-rich copper-binding protein CopC